MDKEEIKALNQESTESKDENGEIVPKLTEEEIHNKQQSRLKAMTKKPVYKKVSRTVVPIICFIEKNLLREHNKLMNHSLCIDANRRQHLNSPENWQTVARGYYGRCISLQAFLLV